MFGGYGLYLDGLMFGLIAYDTLYFKVDDGNRKDYVRAGTGPFTYEGKRRPVKMSYFQIPEILMEDPAELTIWAEKAYAAAKRSRAKKPRKRKQNQRLTQPGRKS